MKAKQSSEVRVTLTKEDFFELRSVIAEISLIELQAQRAATEFKERLSAALQAKDAKWTALTTALHIDPALNYRLDDKTYALVSVNGEAPLKDQPRT